MLYANTDSGKIEKLEKVRSDIDKFISRLDQIQSVNEKQAFEILDECNGLCVRVNGAYGKHQLLFDAENMRLGRAYQAFWDRIKY